MFHLNFHIDCKTQTRSFKFDCPISNGKRWNLLYDDYAWSSFVGVCLIVIVYRKILAQSQLPLSRTVFDFRLLYEIQYREYSINIRVGSTNKDIYRSTLNKNAKLMKTFVDIAVRFSIKKIAHVVPLNSRSWTVFALSLYSLRSTWWHNDGSKENTRETVNE